MKIAVGKGPSIARDPTNPLARVHSMLHCALGDDEARSRVGWMPSHLKESELGLARRSDGQLVTGRDLLGNQLADLLAKQAVEFHRVEASDVDRWKDQMEKAERMAKWVGIATHESNNFECFPYKDSEAARWRAEAARRAKDEAKKGIYGRRRRYAKEKRPSCYRIKGGTIFAEWLPAKAGSACLVKPTRWPGKHWQYVDVGAVPHNNGPSPPVMRTREGSTRCGSRELFCGVVFVAPSPRLERVGLQAAAKVCRRSNSEQVGVVLIGSTTFEPVSIR